MNAENWTQPLKWPPWLYVFAVAALVQFIKFIVYSTLRRRPDFRALFSSNGLPSLYAVVLGCLVTLTWRVGGPEDPAYNAVLIYSGIILHDAMKVKGRVEQGNRMALLVADGWAAHHFRSVRWREWLLPLSSRRSHRPVHVLIGLVVGVSLGLLHG